MKIVAFEGPDYAGKTTLIQEVCKILQGLEVFREPGGTEFGESVRLNLEEYPDIHPDAQLCSFYSSRFELLNNAHVKRSCDKSGAVIFDRFEASSFAYQVVERGASLDVFNALSAEVNKGIRVYYVNIQMDYIEYCSRHQERNHRTSLDRFLDAKTYEARSKAYMDYFKANPCSPTLHIRAEDTLAEKAKQVVAFIRSEVRYEREIPKLDIS